MTAGNFDDPPRYHFQLKCAHSFTVKTIQHNAAFRKRASQVYQQLKPFLFYENLSMRAVYFLISTVVILTVTTQRLRSFAVTC